MLYSIEFLRLLSVLLIVFTHTRHNIVDGKYYFLFEIIPTYGTAILSIISGYLFNEYSSKRSKLLKKKIKTLLIPYLISNGIVIILVLLMKIIGFDTLNRLTYDSSIIFEGLLSFNSEPINPPTFFIRDIFLLFCLISLFKKNYYSILFIIPYLIFGQLFIRIDVIILFICGWFISSTKKQIVSNKNIIISLLLFLSISCISLQQYDFMKFIISNLIFLFLFNINMSFINVGGYSYLLHLYHSPIIVIIYPILLHFFKNEILLVFLQFIFPILIIYFVYKILKYYNISVITGGRL